MAMLKTTGWMDQVPGRQVLTIALWLSFACPAFPAPVDDAAFNAVQRFAQVQSGILNSNAPKLAGGSKVPTLIAQHREAIEACTTHESFAAAVNRLIDDIGLSHFRYYTEDDWSYWHLRSAFFDDAKRNHVEHVGIVPQRIEDRWFVRGVLEGSPADGKGIEVGDELLSVDGMAYSPVGVFRGTAGRKVSLRLSRQPGSTYEVTVKAKRESLYNAVQRAIRKSITTIQHGKQTFAYMHSWTLLGDGGEYDKLLKMQDDVDGLLLDYRDGFGGTWFRAEHFLVGQPDRSESATDEMWTKPVVILTADGTRSAKEIVVYKVKKAGRAPLVGEPTPGHVISVGGILEIGDDALLMVPGFPFDLEGKPILPDYQIPRDIRYCGGEDPQMEFAMDLLDSLIRREKQGITGSWDEAVQSMPNVAKAP